MSTDVNPSKLSSRNKFWIDNRIMLIILISISFVVFLVTIFHLYAQFLLLRQSRRQETLRRLRIIVESPDVHRAPPLRRTVTGLDKAVIAALPVFFVAKGSDGVLECSVCLSSLEAEEIARILPNCKHIFHVECIDKWLGSNSTCPVCRSPAPPIIVAEQREGMVAAPLEEDLAPAKIGGLNSRLSSIQRIIGGEPSINVLDLERQ